MWWTAIVLGLTGSLHCLGMCSPLVMAVTPPSRAGFIQRIRYNAGRITMYAALGAVVAGVGMLLPLSRYQNFLSLALGLVLVLLGLSGIQSMRIPWLYNAIGRLTSFIKQGFAQYLQRKSAIATFVLGALNGLLPCGLTLIALTTCLTLRGPVDGFNFMLLFGVGTLPVMLGVTGWLPKLVRKVKWSARELTTVMLVLSGVILIARVFLVHAPELSSGVKTWSDVILCK